MKNHECFDFHLLGYGIEEIKILTLVLHFHSIFQMIMSSKGWNANFWSLLFHSYLIIVLSSKHIMTLQVFFNPCTFIPYLMPHTLRIIANEQNIIA